MKINIGIELIICWDYDGTLVSSEEIYKNIFVNYLTKNNFVLKNIDDDYYFSKYAGKHPFNVINMLKKDGHIRDDISINLDELNDIFQNELKGSNLLLTKGIEEILESISKLKDVFMAVVTSTFRGDFEAKHNNPAVGILKKYFTLDKNVYICNEIGNKELKPSPNGYLFAYQDIIKKNKIKNIENNILIMVEDSISGCKSASAAKNILKNEINCTVVGYLVGNSFCCFQDLKEAGADIIIATPQEMIDFINNCSKK